MNSPSLCPDSLCLSFPLTYFSSSLFHLPFTVPPSLVHLCSFHFLSASAWFSLCFSNCSYFCVSVPIVSVSLAILPFFFSQPLMSTSLGTTLSLPDSLYSTEQREGTLNKTINYLLLSICSVSSFHLTNILLFNPYN